MSGAATTSITTQLEFGINVENSELPHGPDPSQGLQSVTKSIFVNHSTMAFGDPIEEGACLLPGGSRVEAMDIENLSSGPTRRLVHFFF